MTDDLIKRLDFAEKQFLLAIWVRGTVNDEEFRQNVVGVQWGDHSLGKNELVLSTEDRRIASSCMYHSATYLLAVVADTALEQCFLNRFDHNSTEVITASRIARLIRNAFAHDPFHPVWKIDNASIRQKFELQGLISLDATHLNGKKVERDDYGGPVALLRFVQFVRRLLVETTKSE